MNEIEAKHIWWGAIIILSLTIICGTIIYVQEHSWIIRFEMDNNTLEAVKSINWTSINGMKQVPNYEPIDTSYKIDYNLENKSMPCWKYTNDQIWRCIPQ